MAAGGDAASRLRAMGFFRDLKSLLTTGSRHPAGDGAPVENNVDAMKTDASAAWSPPAEKRRRLARAVELDSVPAGRQAAPLTFSSGVIPEDWPRRASSRSCGQFGEALR